jgi:Fe/S biogenesis protein NfuA
MFTITESAQAYLTELLDKQDDTDVGVRVFVNSPGTPTAETCMAFCRPDQAEHDDHITDYKEFRCYIEKRSVPFLEEALVDYTADKMGGKVTIKAPNSRMPKISDDSPIEDKVNYFLHIEINPSLASHGGQVSLVDIEEEVAILQFGGGCQGCGQVEMTLKDGVEKTLLERVPQLKGVRDVTDHSDSTNAFYK